MPYNRRPVDHVRNAWKRQPDLHAPGWPQPKSRRTEFAACRGVGFPASWRWQESHDNVLWMRRRCVQNARNSHKAALLSKRTENLGKRNLRRFAIHSETVWGKARLTAWKKEILASPPWSPSRCDPPLRPTVFLFKVPPCPCLPLPAFTPSSDSRSPSSLELSLQLIHLRSSLR